MSQELDRANLFTREFLKKVQVRHIRTADGDYTFTESDLSLLLIELKRAVALVCELENEPSAAADEFDLASSDLRLQLGYAARGTGKDDT